MVQGACGPALLVHIHTDVLAKIIKYGKEVFNTARRQEAPLEFWIVEFSAVTREDGRPVVGRVQADTDKTNAPREGPIVSHAIAQISERRMRERTAQRIDAIRIKECQQSNLGSRDSG